MPNTRSRSKETVINSPWIKSETETKATASTSSVTDVKGMEGNKEASGSGEIEIEKTDDDQEVTAGQSFVRTRAQKRKLSFKENREVEVSISLMTSLLYIQIKHSFLSCPSQVC